MEDREGVRPRAGGCPPMPPVRAAKLGIARIVAVARVVILHGRVGADEYFSDRYPSASNSHWIPWLHKQLLIKGHDVQTPEVVRPYLVDYDGWRTEFERHLDDEPMVLVGHSCGGGFLVRWLSEHPLVQVGKLVLVLRAITG
jgi:pimeloyl-ACP methyl ester carboxylesterase